MNISFLSVVDSRNYELSFSLVDVVYSKQSSGEGGGFAKSNEEGLVDLSLRIDERSAKEQNQTSKREDKSGYEL